MMRSFFAVAGLASIVVATAGCNTDCDDADEQVYARYSDCGITLQSSERSGASADLVLECTDERKVIRRAFAQCAKDASCDALTGRDEAGYAQYAACISGE